MQRVANILKNVLLLFHSPHILFLLYSISFSFFLSAIQDETKTPMNVRESTGIGEIESNLSSEKRRPYGLVGMPDDTDEAMQDCRIVGPCCPFDPSQKSCRHGASDEDDTHERDGEDADEDQDEQDARRSHDHSSQQRRGNQLIIRDIIVSGNDQLVSTEAILSHIPYQIGEEFDRSKSSVLIRNLYNNLGVFRNITLRGRLAGGDGIILHIIVEEKTPLKDVIFTGNKSLSAKDIRKKINLEVRALDPEELKSYAEQIRMLYIEKGHHSVEIATEFKVDVDGKGIAYFIINEGSRSLVKQIRFEGNAHVSDKQLRKIIYSREDWILGALDRSGIYIPEKIEGDKHVIEQFYQNSGFFNARVVNVRIDRREESSHLTLTYEIDEGDIYHFGKVSAPGNEKLPEEYLVHFLPIRPGMLYSRERVANAIKTLERIWGNQGFVFAHVDPSMEPNQETKTVDVTFLSDIGNKIQLRKLRIKGNRKTRDKIIRRKVVLDEGELITNSQMDVSKQSVEAMGYFEHKDGVHWKMHRVDDDCADLDLIVREAKTGNVNAQLGFGGAGASFNSPSTGFSFKSSLSDTNLAGTGLHVSADGSYAKNEQTLLVHVAQPWFCDMPVYAACDVYHKRPTYNDLHNLKESAVSEKLTGGQISMGYITQSRWVLLSNAQLIGQFGYERIRYERAPLARISGEKEDSEITKSYQALLDSLFAPGDFVWIGVILEQDFRNHPTHPSRGYRWSWNTRIAAPALCSNIAFYASQFNVNWFTPLIGERDLVLHVHGFLGITSQIGCYTNEQGIRSERVVPYRELFHIGGDRSVRGFQFGQIGPKFLGDSIGAKKAFFWNVELIFPITADMSMKGVIFYDGGVGFDAPHRCLLPAERLTGDHFDYRHSVGFGIRLLNPMPIRIDWGFKIDPRRNRFDPRRNETAHEVHFGMNYDW